MGQIQSFEELINLIRRRVWLILAVAVIGTLATLAYVLWFFLGIFSAHRFYLGRPGTAILQICSYFILIGFVWLLIDIFLIPGMVRENQSALRQRLRNEALAAHGQAPANPYANLASYHDTNIVS